MEKIRIGHGYDVHRLVEDRPLILGGVTVPNKKGLLGHSDADVLAHAVMDAVLGALGLGDIGKHFPDTCERYRGADSIKLCSHVFQMMAERGYRIGNIDATVICQRPKLAPHIDTMRKQIASILSISIEDVNVKAKTAEGLGDIGRGDALECHAVCLLYAD